MSAFAAMLKVNILLALRDKGVLFFSYLFPLVFFFAFAEFMGAGTGGTIDYIVTMVLLLGILGNGLFGAGMRMVAERENRILRRFKVAPISPTPILVGSVLTGWILYLPAVLLFVGLAMLLYGMQMPAHSISLFVVLSVGLCAFRALGLILAAVANSMQEINILVQLFYTPMLFLSGAVFPITALPDWVQIVSQYLPATYLVNALRGIFLRSEELSANWEALVALVVTLVLGLFISKTVFRWDKEDRVSGRAKLWVVAVLAPFLILGTYEAFDRSQIERARVLARSLQRSETRLIRGARIFVGDGQVIEDGSVLIRKGRIEKVFSHSGVAAEDLQATAIEAAGKTLLPGLIDTHVQLSLSGAIPEPSELADMVSTVRRSLAASLYSGVTTVRSVGDPASQLVQLKERIDRGSLLGAEVVLSGPFFYLEEGHLTTILEALPESIRGLALSLSTRQVKTPSEVLAAFDSINTAQLGSLAFGLSFENGSAEVADELFRQAQNLGIPFSVLSPAQTSLGQMATRWPPTTNPTLFEQEPFSGRWNSTTLQDLKAGKISFSPLLALAEANYRWRTGSDAILKRSLVQQVAPRRLLESVRAHLAAGKDSVPAGEGRLPDLEANLVQAAQAGIRLVAGSGAGLPLLFHGAALQMELGLWADAGIDPARILSAATFTAAQFLGQADRIGLIRAGYEANLLLVDGNPLDEMAAIERISAVFFKGERIDRSSLFEQE